MSGGGFEFHGRAFEGRQEIRELRFDLGEDRLWDVLEFIEKLFGTVGMERGFADKVAACFTRGRILFVEVGEHLEDRMIGRKARPAEAVATLIAQSFG
jgi:hypothetical protein